jgi:hydrogenase nickel incorporation protein HypA/HybF
MSLAERVLQIVEQAALDRGLRRVTAIRLEVGALAAVDPEAMRLCFSAVTRNSLAEGARLELVEVAGRARCLQCAKEVAVQEVYDMCPECGSHRLEVTDGKQLLVRDMEAE